MEAFSTKKAGTLYGLYYGLFLIAFSLLLYSTNQESSVSMNILGYVIFIIAMAMAMRKFREGNSGFMSFGKGMTVGFFFTLVTAVIGGLFDTIYLTVVNPQKLQEQLDESLALLESNPGMTDEQIEASAEIAKTFSHPAILFIIAVIGALVIGMIIALVVAAVMKRDNPELDLEED